MLKKIIGFVAAGLLAATTASSTNYGITPTGTGAASGADTVSNGKSLTWFVQNAQAGDRGIMKSGSYTLSVDWGFDGLPGKSGTEPRNIQLIGDINVPGSRTITGDMRFWVAGSRYISVKGVRITGNVESYGADSPLKAVGDSVYFCDIQGTVNCAQADSMYIGRNTIGDGSGNDEFHFGGSDGTAFHNMIADNTMTLRRTSGGGSNSFQTYGLYGSSVLRNNISAYISGSTGTASANTWYRAKYNLIQDNKWTIKNDSAIEVYALNVRDSNFVNVWNRDTVVVDTTGSSTAKIEFMTSGASPNKSYSNTYNSCYFRSNSTTSNGYQHGSNYDVHMFNQWFSKMPFQITSSTDTAYGFTFRHNTFLTTSAGIISMPESTETYASRNIRMVSNLFLSNNTGTGTAHLAWKLWASGGTRDSNLIYSATNSDSTNRYDYAYAPLTKGNRWGNPAVTSWNWGNGDLTPSASGLAVSSDLWPDGYVGAIGEAGPPPPPPPIQIQTDSPLPNGRRTTPYSTNIEAEDGVPPYAGWYVRSGALPDGVALTELDGVGILSGTPTTTGESEFFLGVYDSFGEEATKEFGITVEDVEANFFSFITPTVISDNTAAVTVAIAGDADTNATMTAFYGTIDATDTTVTPVRKVGTNTWDFRLFGLRPATEYQVYIVVNDAGSIEDTTITLTTKAANWWRVPVKGPLIYVDYSKANDSGNGLTAATAKKTVGAAWTTLLAQENHGKGGGLCFVSGSLYYGNAVIEDTGNYASADSMYHIMSDGTATWSGGDERIINGSITLTWATYGTTPAGGTVYYTVSYSGAKADSVGAIFCTIGGNVRRLMKATTRQELLNGHDNGTTTLRRWFRGGGDTIAVYVNGNPATASVRFNYWDSMLWLRTPHVRVHGIKFQHAGMTNGIPVRIGTGGGATFRASGAIVDSCQFRYNADPGIYSIAATSGINDSVVVANNLFFDRMWDFSYTNSKSRDGESVDGIFTDGSHWVIRDNVFQGLFNGIALFADYADSTRGAFNEVYNDTLKYIRDDAIELDVNHNQNVFVGKNTCSWMGNGISIAPAYSGPIWVMYNLLLRPVFTAGFKIGDQGAQVFMYHNTVYSPDGATGSTGLGSNNIGYMKYVTTKNNIFVSGSATLQPIHFNETTSPDTVGAITNSFNWDNLFAWAGTARMLWKNVSYDSVTIKTLIRKEMNGIFSNPFFRDTTAWTDTLTEVTLTLGQAFQPRGSARNRAVRISGVNNNNQFVTSPNPDIGALEYGPVPAARRKGWIHRLIHVIL